MEPSFGVSAYSANAWKRKTLNDYFKCFPAECRRPATSVLWGPWGTPVEFIDRFIGWAAGRNHTVEIHISAETARRTGRNGKQIAPYLNVFDYQRALVSKNPEVLSKVNVRVDNIVERIAQICKPETKIILSVGLEDNLSDKAALVLINTVKKNLKSKSLSWKVCRNPMTRRPRVDAEWVEGHGRTFHAGCQNIWNFDGVHVGNHPKLDDISYDNALKVIQAANKQYNIVYLWSAVAQGWAGSGQPYEGRTYDITPEEQRGFSKIIRLAQK